MPLSLGMELETTLVTCCVTQGRLLDLSGLTPVSVWLLSSSLLGICSQDSGPDEALLSPSPPSGPLGDTHSAHTIHFTGLSLSPWQIYISNRGF